MKHALTRMAVSMLSVCGSVLPAGSQPIEWAQIVEAAKREGTVVVIGPQGSETRDALVQGFQRKYPEIKVEHSGSAGAQLPPKLLAEQKSERYTVDLLVQGTTTVITGLMSVKAVIPIQPYLVGPNTRDASVWLNKQFSFADDAGQYNHLRCAYRADRAQYCSNSRIASGHRWAHIGCGRGRTCGFECSQGWANRLRNRADRWRRYRTYGREHRCGDGPICCDRHLVQ